MPFSWHYGDIWTKDTSQPHGRKFQSCGKTFKRLLNVPSIDQHRRWTVNSQIRNPLLRGLVVMSCFSVAGIDPFPALRPRRCQAYQASLELIGGSVRVDLWADEGDEGREGREGKAQRAWLSDSQCVDFQVSRADRRPSLSTKGHAGETSTTHVHARVLNCSRTVHTHNGILTGETSWERPWFLTSETSSICMEKQPQPLSLSRLVSSRYRLYRCLDPLNHICSETCSNRVVLGSSWVQAGALYNVSHMASSCWLPRKDLVFFLHSNIELFSSVLSHTGWTRLTSFTRRMKLYSFLILSLSVGGLCKINDVCTVQVISIFRS